MRIFVDIDETICYYEGTDQAHARTGAVDYATAIPYPNRIQKINKLYEQGHEIVYWTARGTRTGINWFQVTLKQLGEWGAKFTELRLNKPHYDLYIDDKSINSEAYFDGAPQKSCVDT